ncbi:hypothetical protein RB653_007405 [Dictyostelium firmibasis]|uniref:Uncharacterized protein n=1 Tax=Dictyostelium firmibasis TaxID=79012 RepID=A0AAN7TNJ9_9MYCE
MSAHIEILLPVPFAARAMKPAEEGSSEASYNCEAQGEGSFTGLDYTIPAHTKGRIKAEIQVMAMSSADVNHLNQMVSEMLSATKREEIKEQTKTSASADLSIWSFFTGGDSASASYEDTRNSMKSSGLSDQQITTIVNEMFKLAENMSHVAIDLECDNSQFDYEVSGSVFLYTLAGSIQTDKGTKQYRMLASQGSAGSPDKENAPPVKGKIIPLK